MCRHHHVKSGLAKPVIIFTVEKTGEIELVFTNYNFFFEKKSIFLFFLFLLLIFFTKFTEISKPPQNPPLNESNARDTLATSAWWRQLRHVLIETESDNR